MVVEQVSSRVAAAPGRPYSAAVVAGPIVAVSGQTPIGDDGTVTGPGDPTAQTHLVIDRIEQLLTDAGCTLGDVVKVTVFLSDFAHFPAVNEAYAVRFGEPRPARTAVACALVRPDILVEMDALAVRT